MTAASALAFPLPLSVRTTLQERANHFVQDRRKPSHNAPSLRQPMWQSGDSGYMVTFNKSLDDDDLRPEIGARIAHFLRARYPDSRAKLCAQEFRVKPETAQGWLEGGMPQNKHFTKMLQAFGPAFAAFILEPCGAWVRAWDSLPAKIAPSEHELDQLRADVNDLRRRLDEIGR